MRLHVLMSQLTADACQLTLSTLRNYHTIQAQIQDEAQATLCKKIKKSDGEIDFEDASDIYNKYRAFEGWPGIFSTNGTKVDGLSIVDRTSNHKLSQILSFDDESVVVGCRKGALKIASLQPISKKAMSARAYCVGRGLKVGDTLF
jgi:methionyl-tRNA formyltransferase